MAAGNVRTPDPYAEEAVEDLRSAIATMAEKTPKRISERKSWLSIGMGLHILTEHGWPEAVVRKIWDDVSIGAGFTGLKDEAERDKDWNSFGRSYAGRRTTAGTIYRWARDLGWRPHCEQDHATYFVEKEKAASGNEQAEAANDPQRQTMPSSTAAEALLTAAPVNGSASTPVAPADHVIAEINAKDAACPIIDAINPKDTAPPGLNGASDELVMVCVADVEMRRIEWLWFKRLASGKLTLVAGHPRLGKSLLALYVATCISRGAEWPCGEGRAPLGDVIILSAEDDIADTYGPRLAAMGADTKRIHAITMVKVASGPRRKGMLRGFDLGQDIAQLDGLARLNQSLIIDPVRPQSHLARRPP